MAKDLPMDAKKAYKLAYGEIRATSNHVGMQSRVMFHHIEQLHAITRQNWLEINLHLDDLARAARIECLKKHYPNGEDIPF